MKIAAPKFVLFKTELFVFRQRDEDIDKWSVGGDCAAWFYCRLLLTDRIDRDCEPIMEDWGWTFAVSVDAAKIWIKVWAFQGLQDCWLFGLQSKKRFFGGQSSGSLLSAQEVVRNALTSIMAADPRITKHEWFTENPFDLNVKEF